MSLLAQTHRSLSGLPHEQTSSDRAAWSVSCLKRKSVCCCQNLVPRLRGDRVGRARQRGFPPQRRVTVTQGAATTGAPPRQVARDWRQFSIEPAYRLSRNGIERFAKHSTSRAVLFGGSPVSSSWRAHARATHRFRRCAFMLPATSSMAVTRSTPGREGVRRFYEPRTSMTTGPLSATDQSIDNAHSSRAPRPAARACLESPGKATLSLSDALRQRLRASVGRYDVRQGGPYQRPLAPSRGLTPWLCAITSDCPRLNSRAAAPSSCAFVARRTPGTRRAHGSFDEYWIERKLL